MTRYGPGGKALVGRNQLPERHLEVCICFTPQIASFETLTRSDVFDDNPSGTSFEDIPTSVEEESINQFSFDDVFDAGMLSLLPYDLETNPFVETGSSYHNASSSEQCIVPPQ